ncbi:MAG TPA: hypothetical protein VFS84_18000, partial [Candidatus Binatia bacterium]|nr:hypothetical protein [Candidatus Binatia bacterium]
MRALAQQEITFRRGHTLISQLVAAGEGTASINSYAYRSERIRRDGAPIKWVAVEPVVANLLSSLWVWTRPILTQRDSLSISPRQKKDRRLLVRGFSEFQLIRMSRPTRRVLPGE